MTIRERRMRLDEHDRAVLNKLAEELAASEGVHASEVTIHVCGPDVKGCNHDSDGPMFEDPGGAWLSASCSKCGSLSIDRAVWE